MNTLNTIVIYRHAGTWVFDDDRYALVREPFVAGMPEIIDHHAKEAFGEIPRKIRVTFASQPFPTSTLILERLYREHNGAWYIDKATDRKGWLCPALLHYFKKPPKTLCIALSPVV